ncbi:MAG: ATP-binding cassette domain-containing protein [Deferribacteraceae bacterium]|jgi:lipooligosaccharide transport system ATP-binding protein|nr:ATP-binding cassette domain-containing protein [Deferribacteraceae bacterium]
MIRVVDLKKRYGTFEAVKGVSFEVSKGDFFGFLGPNGAGKTTVMKIMSCLSTPTEGSVQIFGMDVNTHPSDIKAKIGMVAQDNNLDPDFTVLENLLVYAGYYGIKRKDSLPKAMELLSFVDLADRKNDKIQSLSGGMLRRLQIARSLINSPEILIMDEPTTGLDPHSRRNLWEKLSVLREQTGMTMLLTTHYMEEAQSLCSRVAIMDLGKIVTVDSPAHLIELHGGTLEDVYLKLTGRPLDA